MRDHVPIVFEMPSCLVVRMSGRTQLNEVREGLSQLVHDCIEAGVSHPKLDVVERLSQLLDQMDSTLDVVVPQLNEPNTTPQAAQRPNLIQEALDATNLQSLPLASGALDGSTTPNVLSPDSTLRASRKRQSVTFLPESPTAAGSPKSVSPQDGEVHGWLQRTYSGYGSFRRQSKVVSNEFGIVEQALAFASEGMPALDLSSGSPRSAFSRPAKRHTAVFGEASHLFDELVAHLDYEVPELANIDDPNFDVLELVEDPTVPSEARRVFVIVALNVILKYSFVTSYQFPIDKLVRFIVTVSEQYIVSPFHNPVHAADMIQAVHAYFCQPNVKENFSDVELFATLFATMASQLGQLGVNNEFLARVDHPLVRLFTDICPMEAFSAALAFELLRQPELNFTDVPVWKEDPLNQLAFKEVVNEVVLASAARNHVQHIQNMDDVIDNAVVKDMDVPKLLAAVVHVADCRYAVSSEHSYLKWVGYFTEENYRQGDAEKALGLTVSDLCDRETGHSKVKAQIGFLQHVIQPLFSVMSPVLPKAWKDQLMGNLNSHGGGPSPRNSFVLQSPSSLRSDDDITLPSAGRWIDESGPKLERLLQIFRKPSADMHYIALLRLLSNHLADAKHEPDFPGHVISLAIKLDPKYIGSRAAAALSPTGISPQLDTLSFDECTRLAFIVSAEALPNTMSMVIDDSTGSNPFLILLLHIFSQITGSDVRGRSDSRQGLAGEGSYGRWMTPVRNNVYRRL